jgi:hypothetical protein
MLFRDIGQTQGTIVVVGSDLHPVLCLVFIPYVRKEDRYNPDVIRALQAY